MAVHLVSLPRLREVCLRERGRPDPGLDEAGASGARAAPMADRNPAPPSEAAPQPAKPSPVPVTEALPVSSQPALGASPQDIQTFVQQSGTDGGRVLLGLIYRIAAIEAQLAELRHNRVVIAQPQNTAVQTLPCSTASAQPIGEGKAGLLEQLFRSNVELWNSLEDSA